MSQLHRWCPFQPRMRRHDERDGHCDSFARSGMPTSMRKPGVPRSCCARGAKLREKTVRVGRLTWHRPSPRLHDRRNSAPPSHPALSSVLVWCALLPDASSRTAHPLSPSSPLVSSSRGTTVSVWLTHAAIAIVMIHAHHHHHHPSPSRCAIMRYRRKETSEIPLRARACARVKT